MTFLVVVDDETDTDNVDQNKLFNKYWNWILKIQLQEEAINENSLIWKESLIIYATS